MTAKHFFVEMTDTYAGEANYAWVNRFKVSASSFRGAILKVARETGYSGRIRKTADYGSEMVVHDVRGACIRFFTEDWDQDRHQHFMTVKEL